MGTKYEKGFLNNIKETSYRHKNFSKITTTSEWESV
jgi:hypothetical protein